MKEKYIKSVCSKCKKEESVYLSDVLSGKKPKTGLPATWEYFGDYVDYQPYFLLCGECKTKWFEHLQKEIEKFVINNHQ